MMNNSLPFRGLYRSAQLYPDKVAIYDEENEITWLALHKRVLILQNSLRKLGVSKESKLAVLSLNSIEYAVIIYASIGLGSILVPLNTRLSPEELQYQLQDSESDFILFDSINERKVDRIKNSSNKKLKSISLSDKSEFADFSYKDLISTKSAEVSSTTINQPILPNDPLAIVYTGGTTGLPKGVLLTHQNMNYNISSLVYDLNIDISAICALNPPLFHLSGLGPLLAYGMFGATSVLTSQFDTEKHLKIISQFQCTQTSLVPTTLTWMLDFPNFEKYDLSSLKSIVYGSAPITAALLERALSRFPKLSFTQFYGQTEFSGAISILRNEDHSLDKEKVYRLRSCGKPHFAAEVRILDEDGKELERGNIGEICAQGEGVFSGYLNNKKQTYESLRNGWLHTGDAGYMDQDGYIYLADRMKDMIVTGGENVATSEPENILARHPDISEVAVFGIPDDEWGEKVHAVIVLKNNRNLDQEQIITYCKKFIAGYKCPKSVNFRKDSLPLSSVGKVKKDTLRKEYMNGNKK